MCLHLSPLHKHAGRHLDDAIPYLSIYLGHENLDETSKYLKFSNEMFPDAIDLFWCFHRRTYARGEL